MAGELRAAGGDVKSVAVSKLEALPRKLASRTVDALGPEVSSAIDIFTPAGRANYFAAAGYDGASRSLTAGLDA